MPTTSTPDPLSSDVRLGVEDGGPVAVRRLPDGRALLLPAVTRGRQLSPDGLDVLADVQGSVRRLQAERQALDELVGVAREAGVSWNLIGFSVGITAQSARERWGT